MSRILPVGIFFCFLIVTCRAEDGTRGNKEVPPVKFRVLEKTLAEAGRRDVWGISFHGNRQFSDEALRRALMNDGQVQQLVWPFNVKDEKLWPADTRAEFERTIIERLTASYHYAGYCAVSIKAGKAAPNEPPEFQITEGPRFVAAAPTVTGVDERLRRHLIQQLTEVTGDRIAGRSIDHPWWEVGAPASVAFIAQSAIQRHTSRLLRDDGFEFATVTVVQEPDAALQTVHLKVHVDPDRRILIDKVNVQGNTEYAVDEILKIAGVRVGAAASRSECERIERLLLDTGRFTHVHVWPDTPFDANDDVALNVEVREYDGISRQNGPSPKQHSVLKLATWLNNWSAGGGSGGKRSDNDEDFSFHGFVDLGPNPLTATSDLRKYLTSGQAEEIFPVSHSDDPIRNAIVAMLPLHLLPEGRLEYKAVVSPGVGSAVTFKLRSEGRVVADLAVLNTNELDGIVSHQSQKCWVRKHAGQPSFQPVRLHFDLNGSGFHVALNLTAPNQFLSKDDPPGTAFQAGRNQDASKTRQGPVEINVVAAVLLKVVESTFGSLSDQDVVATSEIELKTKDNALSIDAATGELIRAGHSTESFDLTLVPEPGKLKSEIAAILKQSDAHTNVFDAKRVKGSLIRFAADEAAAIYSSTNMPLHLLAARILQDSETADVAADAVEKLQRISVGSTPQDFFQGADPASIRMFRTLQVLTPTKSLSHRWFAAGEVAERRMAASQLYARFMDVVTNENAGPLDCLVAAGLYRRWFGSSSPNGVAAILTYGERRLTEERFIRNVEDLLAEDCAAGQIIRRAIEVVQEYSDEDFAALREAIEMRPDKVSPIAAVLYTVGALKRMDSVRQRSGRSADEIIRAEFSAAFRDGLDEKLRAYFHAGLPATKPVGSIILSGQSKEKEAGSEKKKDSKLDGLLKHLGPLEVPGL